MLVTKQSGNGIKKGGNYLKDQRKKETQMDNSWREKDQAKWYHSIHLGYCWSWWWESHRSLDFFWKKWPGSYDLSQKVKACRQRKITWGIYRQSYLVSMGSWQSRFQATHRCIFRTQKCYWATFWWYWKENLAVLERFHRKIHKRKHGAVGGGICWIQKLEEWFKRSLKLKVS